jgi:hypothetical protein
MKYIIFYNECLRSKIIYSKFIEQNKRDIRCIIKLPINANSKNKFFLLKKGIFNNNAHSYILFQLFQTILYNFFSKIFFSNVESISKKLNINFINLKYFPSQKEMKKIIKNYNAKDIIFVSTTYILKNKDLIIKNPILNLHEANPKKYKGSAIYFVLAHQKKRYMETVIMEPNKGIDTGRIILTSSKKKIKNFSIFQIILAGYQSQNNLMKRIKNTKIEKKYPNIKNTKKTEVFSFPSRKIEKDILKNNIQTILFKDYFFILHLSIMRDINKLYSTINTYLYK